MAATTNDSACQVHSDGRPPSAWAAAWGRAWSRPAALRSLRTALVVPALLVFAFKIVGDPEMATYATFGSFANPGARLVHRLSVRQGPCASGTGGGRAARS